MTNSFVQSTSCRTNLVSNRGSSNSPWTTTSYSLQESSPFTYHVPKSDEVPFTQEKTRLYLLQKIGLLGTWIGAAFFFIAVLIYPTNLYRDQIKTSLQKSLGQGIGGYAYLANPIYFAIGMGVTTLLAAIAFASAGGKTQFPSILRHLFIFLQKKNKFFLSRNFHITNGDIFFVGTAILLNVYYFGWFLSNQLLRLRKSYDKAILRNKPNDIEFIQYYNFFTLEKIGLCFGFNLTLTMAFLLFPATKGCMWMELLNISYVHAIKYHRWLGFACLGLLFCHIVPYYISWIKRGILWDQVFPCFRCDLNDQGGHQWVHFTGEMAFLCMLIMSITSLAWFRRRYYEIFYYAHHLFIPAILFSCMHFQTFIWWLYPSLCLYMVHRILSRSQCNVPTRILNFEALPHGYVRIVFERALHSIVHTSGQIIYLRIPSLSILQWHAFTISSSTLDSPTSFTVHTKALGGWTENLYNLALTNKNSLEYPIMYVDGFYGVQTRIHERYPILVMIGGGIGITPLISFLGDIFHAKQRGLPIQCQSVWLFWSSRDVVVFKEFEPQLTRLHAMDPFQEFFKIRLALTKEVDPNDFQYVRPDTTTHNYGGGPVLNDSTLSYAQKKNSLNTKPFCQSATKSWEQILLFLMVFGSTAFFIFYLRYDRKISKVTNGMWPLQNAMEFVICVVGLLLGFISIKIINFYREKYNQQATAKDLMNNKFTNVLTNTQSLSCDEPSFLLNPEILPKRSNRFDFHQVVTLLENDYKKHQLASPNKIGVFMSGSKELTRGAEQVLSTASDIFEFHEEHFEL